MQRYLAVIGILFFVTMGVYGAEDEPALKKVFSDLDITVGVEDEILVEGPAQGIFAKTGTMVEVVLAAKYSFGVQEATSEVRMGYYPVSVDPRLFTLFTCGPKAGDQSSITGLPAEPLGPYYFDPGSGPIGFYVQSKNFNPNFSQKNETVYTQDHLNKQIERFGSDVHKVKIYPYETKTVKKEDWFILCWEFSTNNDFQDLITVVRGVKLIGKPLENESKSSSEMKGMVTMAKQ